MVYLVAICWACTMQFKCGFLAVSGCFGFAISAG